MIKLLKSKIIPLLSIGALLASCGINTPVNNDSKSNYLLIGPGGEGLVLRAKEDSINICERSENGGDKSSQRKQFEVGMKLWWDALNIAEKPITYDAPGKECDATIIVKPGVHAHVRPSTRPKIYMAAIGESMGRQVVMTHEIGHAVGLADTYASFLEYNPVPFVKDSPHYYNPEARCKPGQTDVSIMCNPENYPTPQQDDIDGIREVYKNVFGSYPAAE